MWNAEEAKSLLNKRTEYYFVPPASGKGELKKSYCYQVRNQLNPHNHDTYKWKHIVIARERTDGSVTAYVNARSVSGSPLHDADIQGLSIAERFPVGHRGRTGDRGIAASVAKLDSLDPLKNEVLRLHIEGPSSFSTLLDWYAGVHEFPRPEVVGVAAIPADLRTSVLLAGIADIKDQSSLDPQILDRANDSAVAVADSDGETSLRMDDSEKRAVIEKYAVQLAKEFYLNIGFDVEERGKPFDLLCRTDGLEVHVEVKGTTGSGSRVILTRNEVRDARNTTWRSDLFIVRDIELSTLGATWIANGGSIHRIEAWVPVDEDLSATEFEYNVPEKC